MRGAMDGDVAAKRQLNVVERLLVRMPRDRGFRVHTDGSVSVYPASSRARLPAEKQKSSPRLQYPSVNRARRRRGASVLRTHAPAAALHARRSTPKAA